MRKTRKRSLPELPGPVASAASLVVGQEALFVFKNNVTSPIRCVGASNRGKVKVRYTGDQWHAAPENVATFTIERDRRVICGAAGA